MLTPKGSSFLYVKKEFQQDLDPLVVSWGYNPGTPMQSQFLEYHQFNGTRDFSAYLTIPAAIRYMEENDWWNVAKECRELGQQNYRRFCDLLETAPLAPVKDEFIGQLFSIPVKTSDPAALKTRLFNEFKIEIPVMPHANKVYLRYSLNAFNSQEDLDKLYDAMKTISRS
jgi:isopenicillin-N epimerase